jgi:hypothetical protein
MCRDDCVCEEEEHSLKIVCFKNKWMFKCGFYYLRYSDSFTLIDLGTSTFPPTFTFSLSLSLSLSLSCRLLSVTYVFRCTVSSETYFGWGYFHYMEYAYLQNHYTNDLWGTPVAHAESAGLSRHCGDREMGPLIPVQPPRQFLFGNFLSV